MTIWKMSFLVLRRRSTPYTFHIIVPIESEHACLCVVARRQANRNDMKGVGVYFPKYTVCVSASSEANEKSCFTFLLRAIPNECLKRLSCRSVSKEFLIARMSLGAVNKPDTLCSTTSGIPPTRLATTGKELSPASSSA